MLSVSYNYAEKMGLKPYYMYRQKNMVGSFENVGYCKEGTEGVYNVEIMEENQCSNLEARMIFAEKYPHGA